jgi:hypothetical protein
MTVILASRWITDPAPYNMRQTDAKLSMFDSNARFESHFGKEIKLSYKI